MRIGTGGLSTALSPKNSFGKIILDSHLSIQKKEAEDHLILF